LAQPRPKRSRPVARRARPDRDRLPTPDEAEAFYLELDRRLAYLALCRDEDEEIRKSMSKARARP
jgi:hypothetical protein